MHGVNRFEPKLSWSSSNDDLITCFYRPVLKNAVLYQRKAGYFSSTSFARVTREIIELIERRGRIQLITSPNFSTTDKRVIESSVEERERIISESFLNDINDDTEGTKSDFVKLMAYMLVNEIDGHPQLEIKIAMTNDGEGIFHEKLGVIHYSGNDVISFSGSVNETISGWTKNIENFKVFCSWKDNTNRQAVDDDKKSFSDLWNGNETGVRIFDLPTAVRRHLLQISPKSDLEYQQTLKNVYQKIGYGAESDVATGGLRTYQVEARKNWIKNNHRGLFAMATGTGKTFAALGCISSFQKSNKRTMTVIACPQTHLVEQWKDEVGNYNSQVPRNDKVLMERKILCYDGNASWRREFGDISGEFNDKLFSGKYLVQHVVVFVTHKTLNSDDFKKFILRVADAKLLLIVDEVHNIGSSLSLLALLDRYDSRLGLSATPVRHYDEDGTRVITDYFGGIVFELPLNEAIEKSYLCNYEYRPHYAELNAGEMDTYNDLTMKILYKYAARNDQDEDDAGNYLTVEIQRANLVANAQNKLNVLEEIINSTYQMRKTLIYCTSSRSPSLPYGEPSQLDKVKQVLEKNGIVSTSVTFRNPAKDRRMILEDLAHGHYDCITAVRCLDEGVDIPSVETAIIMASSGNPRQYIQRRGRVLRQSQKTGKRKAIIHDILVKPPIPDAESDIRLRERKLVARELLRHKEFATIALNREEAIAKISGVASAYEIDLDLLSYEYIENM